MKATLTAAILAISALAGGAGARCFALDAVIDVAGVVASDVFTDLIYTNAAP
ncbi:MAG: hypothetical protein AAF682_29445 [Planctomycetota bacterium]